MSEEKGPEPKGPAPFFAQASKALGKNETRLIVSRSAVSANCRKPAGRMLGSAGTNFYFARRKRDRKTHPPHNGEMAEWSKAHAC